MSFTVNQISPVLGAEITDLDLSKPIGDNLVAEIRQTWLDAGGLLVIRGQTLTTDQHIAFSRQFGPLFGEPGNTPLQETVSRYLHPDHPEIYRVSNQVENGQPQRPRRGRHLLAFGRSVQTPSRGGVDPARHQNSGHRRRYPVLQYDGGL